MAYKVYLVYKDGNRHLAGGVEEYKLKKTAESAAKHYERFLRLGGDKSTRVEIVEA